MKIYSVLSFRGTKLHTVYYNDIHGNIKNLDGFLYARDEFTSKNPSEATFTLSSGDVFIDNNKNNDLIASKLLSKTDAVAIGNHDVSFGEQYFRSMIEKFKLGAKFLRTNISFSDEKLNAQTSISKKISRNGETIGVIGLSPFDLTEHISLNPKTEGIKVEKLQKTIDKVKSEIKKLEAQGVNKIFLLSHTGKTGKDGENFYNLFAKLGGIDVIIGGHDHIEVNTMVYSNRNEPVLIVSTGESSEHGFGKNLDWFGMLNLEFDEDGRLIPEKCENIFAELKSSCPDNSKLICSFNSPFLKTDANIGHNEFANLVADSNLWYVNKTTKGKKADFSFVNPGTIRECPSSKDITQNMVEEALPFTSTKLIKAELTKKQIKETLEYCAKSTLEQQILTGVMHVSGMEYTINPDLSVSNIHILNQDGSIKYSLDDFKDEDTFTCVYDTFMQTGAIGLSMLKKDDNSPDVEVFDVSRQTVLKDYLLVKKQLYDYKKIRILNN